MSRLVSGLIAVGLAACHPTQVAQTCPTPAATAPAAMLVTQVLLRRGPDAVPAIPDFTLSLTASGDALYVGSSTVPVPGEYMGRLGPAGFQRLVTDLVARGLALDTDAQAAATLSCSPQPVISVSIQTADGRYSGTAFCGRTDSESRLAGPIYSAIEQIRWYPGAKSLAIGPVK